MPVPRFPAPPVYPRTPLPCPRAASATRSEWGANSCVQTGIGGGGCMHPCHVAPLPPPSAPPIRATPPSPLPANRACKRGITQMRNAEQRVKGTPLTLTPSPPYCLPLTCEQDVRVWDSPPPLSPDTRQWEGNSSPAPCYLLAHGSPSHVYVPGRDSHIAAVSHATEGAARVLNARAGRGPRSVRLHLPMCLGRPAGTGEPGSGLPPALRARIETVRERKRAAGSRFIYGRHVQARMWSPPHPEAVQGRHVRTMQKSGGVCEGGLRRST